MQLVTPRVVATAESTDITICRIIFHLSLFIFLRMLSVELVAEAVPAVKANQRV